MKKITKIYRTVSSIIVVTFISIGWVIVYYLKKLWNLIKKLWKKNEK
tara:strand:- start:2 stop:142 length:141 start_codon:yes stop_codon:yes gene_type:complete